jgi:hypothetical protein
MGYEYWRGSTAGFPCLSVHPDDGVEDLGLGEHVLTSQSDCSLGGPLLLVCMYSILTLVVDLRI